MPVQKSAAFAKYKAAAAKAHDAHKADATTWGNAGLPAGIEGGVAQLVDCKIAEYKEGNNKGQPFFMAAGVVVSPETHEGAKIAGLRTQIGPEPLCNTPQAGGKRKTFDDHYAWMENELSKFTGGDRSRFGPDEVEAFLVELKEAKPFFRFRTWKGSKATSGPYKDKEPKVQHEWNGVTEAPEGVEPGAGMTAHEGNGEATGQEAGAEAGEFNEFEDGQAGGEPDSGEGPDLAALGEAADGGDKAAEKQLVDAAKAAGMTKEQIEGDYQTWADLAAALNAPADEAVDEAAEPEPEPEPWKPVKGETGRWKPLGKDKKPLKNKAGRAVKVDVEFVAVYAKNQTADVKGLADHKVTKGVPWSQLEAPPE